MIKLAAVVAILGTLAGLDILSHVASQDRAQRIACVHNQHLMCDALVSYRMDNAGNNSPTLAQLKRFYVGVPRNFAKCPADSTAVYSYHPSSGGVACPNPGHRPGL